MRQVVIENPIINFPFVDWNQTRVEENKTINDIRRCVKEWREGRYADDLTRTTARLLEHWLDARCRFRHHTPDQQDSRRPLPRLPRRGRHAEPDP